MACNACGESSLPKGEMGRCEACYEACRYCAEELPDDVFYDASMERACSSCVRARRPLEKEDVAPPGGWPR